MIRPDDFNLKMGADVVLTVTQTELDMLKMLLARIKKIDQALMILEPNPYAHEGCLLEIKIVDALLEVLGAA